MKKFIRMIKNSSRTCKSFFVIGLFLIMVGIINELFPYIGMEDILSFISYIYFIYAFVTLVCYLYSRKDKDYELILLSVSSVLIGAFFYLVNDYKIGILLGTGVLSFGLQAVAVRIYSINRFYKEGNYLWLSKTTTTVLLTLMTILITVNLFLGTTEVHTMLFGFYFIVYGILYMLDLILGVVVKTNKFKKFMHSE